MGTVVSGMIIIVIFSFVCDIQRGFGQVWSYSAAGINILKCWWCAHCIPSDNGCFETAAMAMTASCKKQKDLLPLRENVILFFAHRQLLSCVFFVVAGLRTVFEYYSCLYITLRACPK
jgi:hypothetical protein